MHEWHITEESLRFCFQLLSENTVAREAVLEIKSAVGNVLTLISFEIVSTFVKRET